LKSAFHLALVLPGQIACGALMFQVEPLRFDLLDKFAITNSQFGFLLSQFIIGQMIASFFAASISYRIGVKLTYLLGTGVALAAAALFAFAATFEMAFWIRFILGIGSGIQFVMGSSYIFWTCSPHKRSLFQGLFGSFFNLGSGLIFLLAQGGTPADRWNLVCLTPLTLLVLSFIGFAVFSHAPAHVTQHATRRHFGLLIKKPIILLAIIMFGSWGTFVVLGHWLSVYLVNGIGAHIGSSAIATGIVLLFSAFGRAAGGLIAPVNSERVALVVYSLIAAVSGLAMAWTDAVWAISAAAIVMIVASSMCFGPVLTMLPKYVDSSGRDMAISFVLSGAMLLTTVCAPALGMLLDAGAQNVSDSVWFIIAIPVIAAVAALML